MAQTKSITTRSAKKGRRKEKGKEKDRKEQKKTTGLRKNSLAFVLSYATENYSTIDDIR